MQITIQGHGLKLSQPLKEYAGKKISKLDEFFNGIMKAEIILDTRDIRKAASHEVAEVSLWVSGKKVIRASEAGSDMYSAIDQVIDELKMQLKKHKEKTVQEKRREGKKSKRLSREFKEKVAPADGPQIVSRSDFQIKNMTRDEAKAELKLLGHDFIVFRNVEDGEVNILYGRKFIDSTQAPQKTKEEAAAALGKSRKLIAFLNPDTNQLNVLYRRNSGNFGLIEPSL